MHKSAFGDHRGCGDNDYEDVWRGHGVVMLRQPEQRLVAAWRAGQLSWPDQDSPPANITQYAQAVQGCAVRMLTRGSTKFRQAPQASASSALGLKDKRSAVVALASKDPLGAPCGSFQEPSPDEVQTAKARLREGFVFVGLADHWELSICLFHAMLGGHCHRSEFEGVGRPQNLKLLNGWSDPYDGQLYCEGVATFRRNLALHGVDSDESCQKCLREAQADDHLGEQLRLSLEALF